MARAKPDGGGGRVAREAAALASHERLAYTCLAALFAFLPVTVVVFTLLPLGGTERLFHIYLVPLLQVVFVAAVWRAGHLTTSPLVPRIAAALSLWLGLGFVIALFGAFPAGSVVWQAQWALWVVFAFALLAFFRARPERIAPLLRLIVAVFLVYAAILHVMALGIDDPDYDWWHGLPGFLNVRFFGFHVVLVIAAQLGLMWREPEPQPTSRRLLDFFYLSLALALLFWSGGRNPVLGMTAVAVLLAALRLIPKPLATLRLVAAAAVIAVPWSMSISVPSEYFGLFRFVESVQADSVAEATTNRTILWQEVGAMIAEAPLAGHGPGTMGKVQGGFVEHPHNIVLQAVFDWGLIVGGLFLAGLALLGWRLLAAGPLHGEEADNDGPGAGGATVAAGLFLAGSLAAMSMFDGIFYHPAPLAYFALALALAWPRVAERLGGGEEGWPWHLRGLTAASVALVLWGAFAQAVYFVEPEPEYGGWRARLTRAVPTALRPFYGETIYGQWIDSWRPTLSQEQLLEETVWHAAHSGLDPAAMLARARLACARGSLEEALKQLEPADAMHSGWTHRTEAERLRAEFATRWNGCRLGATD